MVRMRVLLALVGTFTIAGAVIGASAATGSQMTVTPPLAIPSSAPVAAASSPSAVAPPSALAASTQPVASTPVVAPASPCDTSAIPFSGASVRSSKHLPALAPDLESAWAKYAADPPAGAGFGQFYDSGGAFGGGIPANAVRTMMRQGLASGLSDAQVRSFLNPSLLRGLNDPYGGAGLLRFVTEQGNPTFYAQLAAFSGSRGGEAASPQMAQDQVFEAFPRLAIVYAALAGRTPPDVGGAAFVVQLADAGYAPAIRSIDRAIASGNHPSAGARESGGVGDWIDPSVYDYYVVNFHGRLSADARQAVANRKAYRAWVGRISAWWAGGSLPDQIPEPATFPAPPSGVQSTSPDASCAG